MRRICCTALIGDHPAGQGLHRGDPVRSPDRAEFGCQRVGIRHLHGFPGPEPRHARKDSAGTLLRRRVLGASGTLTAWQTMTGG